MDFAVYNITFIRGFNLIITVVCAKTRILWVFPTASKRSPVRIIIFILTTLNNKQHPCKTVRVDEDGALENSTDLTNLLIGQFKISMETTGGDVSWMNINNERHNRSIRNMVRAGLIDVNQHTNNFFCAA